MEAASHHLTRVLSHGMNADAVISDWPALTSAEVTRVLRHYPQLGAIKRLVWHSPRPFSAGCVMTTDSGDIFVKRHHLSVRGLEDLREEHRFISHLRSRGVAVSEVLRTNQGDTAVADDHWTYEVHAVAAGVDLYRDAVSWTPFTSSTHASMPAAHWPGCIWRRAILLRRRDRHRPWFPVSRFFLLPIRCCRCKTISNAIRRLPIICASATGAPKSAPPCCRGMRDCKRIWMN